MRTSDPDARSNDDRAPASAGNQRNEPWVEVTGSAWLAEQKISLAFTTYETGKLFLLGHKPEGALAVVERTFNRAMGLWADGQTLWLSTRYVTAVSQSDVVDGWRDRRQNGGVVLEVPGGRVLASGLSMPHSPRLYRGRLWLHNSGAGFFGSIDPGGGLFEPLTFCPGYLRGLAFTGDYAVAGLSHPRHEKTFSGLALETELAKRDAEPRCGLLIIDLRSGDVAHWIRVEGIVRELYDVAVLPGVSRPMALGLKSDEIERIIAIGEDNQR